MPMVRDAKNIKTEGGGGGDQPAAMPAPAAPAPAPAPSTPLPASIGPRIAAMPVEPSKSRRAVM